MSPINYIRRSAAGILVGIVALTMVTAVLGGSLAAIRANATIDALAKDLHSARAQIDELNRANAGLAEQNRRILAQNNTLVRFLRHHGLHVPKTARATPPSATAPAQTEGPSSSPKPRAPMPGHQSTATPRPSASPSSSPSPTGMPTSPSTPTDPLEPLCTIAPILCTGTR